MPRAILSNADERQKYLIDLFKTTYFKDTIEHNNLRKAEILNDLFETLSSMCGQLLNSDNIANTFVVKQKLILIGIQ